MQKFLSLILTGLCSLIGVSGNCVTDLAGNNHFIGCMQGMVMTTQSMDASDPMSICKGDFKKHMLCLSSYIKQCPQLYGDANGLGAIKPFLDQFEIICSAHPATCPGYDACYQKVQSLAKDQDMQPSGNSTPFSIIPYAVYSLCSVFKEQIKCLDEYRSSCPEVVKHAEEQVTKSLQDDPTVKMNMEGVRDIQKNLCPKIPKGFESNTCVRTNLESQKFISCMLDVKRLSSRAPKNEQCKFYYDGLACIEESIGKPCGRGYSKAIEDSAHLVIHDLPENCDRKVHGVTKRPESDHNKMVNDAPPENGCDRIRFSVNVLIMLLMIILLHKA